MSFTTCFHKVMLNIHSIGFNLHGTAPVAYISRCCTEVCTLLESNKTLLSLASYFYLKLVLSKFYDSSRSISAFIGLKNKQ